MRPLNRILACVFLLLLAFSLASQTAAQTTSPQAPSTSNASSYWDDPINWKQQFVPASQPFWDDSRHWTTNYGPAYRDTMVKETQMLACSSQFALCFHSGAEPLPCTLSPDGRSADCKCLVYNQKNFVLLTAILNYPVYRSTLQQCNGDGTGCLGTNIANVCQYLPGGALIPGANVISTYDRSTQEALVKVINRQLPSTTCSKGPFAACMTAPCTTDPGSPTATCKCPVFYGRFTLTGVGAQCSLGGNLIPSASYIPALDPDPNQ